ncbi:metallophosphoesterase [Deinococcus sp. HMF7604]|uniref:metallophosphoesterase n=1 Tax=Deinococcus betulae TaxID=2873312 RepID=UPI001CC9D1D8|nr:metallophosphoesterase [Deinococcus betulae]MBZ9752710.1 metallophosphoesterase [Deinococcus betulae]
MVPDLHGHLPRLQTVLNTAREIPGVSLVFLGDLIDDAPHRRLARRDDRSAGAPDDSREVLRQVRALHAAGQATVLLGNHEVMAIGAVLDGHEGFLNIWWRHGGREAAAGYGWRLRDTAGPLPDDLRWLREHGRLWCSVGPPGQQVLAAHATRPNPLRIERGLERAEFLTPNAQEDPVVWFPLGLEDGCEVQWPLPEGHQASVHGHMEWRQLRTLQGPDHKPAYQLDLEPAIRKLGMLHVNVDGKLTTLLRSVL